VAVLILFGASALALAVAPFALDSSYSWIRHTTSEAAGQGVRCAWLARLGFLSLGLAVLFLSQANHQRWGPLGLFLLGSFGVSMGRCSDLLP
jgi:hypothetical protein